MSAANAGDLVRTAARLRSTLLLYWVSGTKPSSGWSGPMAPSTRAASRSRARGWPRSSVTPRRSRMRAAGIGGARPSCANRQRPGASCYTLLIAPVRTAAAVTERRAADDRAARRLSNLSFAALQDARGRYLLEDYTLHYAPAGALFQFTAAQRGLNHVPASMLMVSDPDPARRSTLDAALPRLPGARAEAAAITRQIPSARCCR